MYNVTIIIEPHLYPQRPAKPVPPVAVAPQEKPKSFFGLDDEESDDETDSPYPPSASLYPVEVCHYSTVTNTCTWNAN